MSLPTLTDLKIHANIPADVVRDDDELTDMLDAAIDIVTDLVGPIAEPAAVTETHYGMSSDVLVLRRMPVASLTAVSYRAGATTTALTLGDYELDAATGLVRVASGSRFYGTYTVTYTAGLATMPAAIRLAVLIIASHLWETQRGTSPTALSLQQPDFADPGTFGMGFAIPTRARELLTPYLRPSIA